MTVSKDIEIEMGGWGNPPDNSCTHRRRFWEILWLSLCVCTEADYEIDVVINKGSP